MPEKSEQDKMNGSNIGNGNVPTRAYQEGPIVFTNKTRLDEKNALIGLNNRFAALIEKNQDLELANSNLRKEIQREKETTVLTVTRLKHAHEKDIGATRKALQDAERDMVKSNLERDQLQKEIQDMKAKLDKKAQEAAGLQKKLFDAEQHINKINTDLLNAGQNNKELLNVNKDLGDENDRLADQLNALIKKLEAECMEKMELQTELQVNAQELASRAQVYDQEIANLHQRRQTELDEMDGRLQKEYETKLADDIQLLRNEYAIQLQANKEAQDDLYKVKEADLKGQIQRLKDIINNKTQEIAYITAKMEATVPKIAGLEGELHTLQQIIKDLEKRIKDDQNRYENEKKKRDAENEQLRGDKDRLIKEYRDLLDTKVELYNEIATYQMLLEREERRMSVTPEPFERHKKTYTDQVEETRTTRFTGTKI